jgi:hypothetical protein
MRQTATLFEPQEIAVFARKFTYLRSESEQFPRECAQLCNLGNHLSPKLLVGACNFGVSGGANFAFSSRIWS